MAVAAFVSDVDARAELRSLGGIEPLVKMLASGNDEVRRNSSWAISVCATDEPTAMAIASLGSVSTVKFCEFLMCCLCCYQYIHLYSGLEQLQDVQLSSSRKNAFTDAALESLLNHNLSAKYGLTGFLGMTLCYSLFFSSATNVLTINDSLQAVVIL